MLRRAQFGGNDNPFLEMQDIHLQVRSQQSRRLIVFTIDTSDSMADGPGNRMAAALGAIVSLATTAYLNRDQVCLVAFRDREASLVVPPTSSVALIRQQLNRLPIGGATPLAAGLKKAKQVIEQGKFKNPMLSPLLVLISDGMATAALKTGEDPDEDALTVASQLNKDGVSALIIDTCALQNKTSKMNRLAEVLGGNCHHIHNLQAGQILQLIENTDQEK